MAARGTHGRHVVPGSQTYDYRRCERCRTVYLAAADSPSFTPEHYDASYYDLAGPAVIRSWVGRHARRQQNQKYRRIRRTLPGPANRPVDLLDLGCGDGGFLAGAPEFFSVCGAEINPDGIQHCRRRNLAVIERDLGVVEPWPHPFDVVTLWHVLEHIPRPDLALQNARLALRPGGILFLTVPNIDSLGYRLGRGDWFHLDAPRHRFLPSGQGIRHLLHHNGFTGTTPFRDSWTFPLDLFWSVRNTIWRFPFLPVYPLMKWISRDSLGFMARKNPSA